MYLSAPATECAAGADFDFEEIQAVGLQVRQQEREQGLTLRYLHVILVQDVVRHHT
jgi:hypothetical protein